MVFETIRISKGCNNTLETAGFITLMHEYLQRIYSESAIRNGLLYDLAEQITKMEKHAILAFEAGRDKRREIVEHTFKPKGFAYFRLRKKEWQNHIDCGIEHIFSRGSSIGVELCLMNSVVSEIKEFSRGLKIKPPEYLRIELPRYAQKNLDTYLSLPGFNILKEDKDSIIVRSRISS